MNKVNQLLSEIKKRKSKSNIVNADGEVFGHIINSDKKNYLFSLKMKIRKVLPEVKFKILKKISNQGKISWELYGDYYKYSGEAKSTPKDIYDKNIGISGKGYIKI